MARFYTPASGALFVLRSASYVASPTSETLVRSDDGGDTWRDVALPPGPTGEDERRVVEVDPLNHLVIYASGQEGLYKTDDDAATWRVVLPHQLQMGQVAVSRADDNLVYVTQTESNVGITPSRILRSRDGGETWDPILDAACAQMRLFPDPTNAARLVAALNCMPDRPAALYLSEDQGTTWSTWQTVAPGRRNAWTGPRRAAGGRRRDRQSLTSSTSAFAAHSLEDGLPLYPDARRRSRPGSKRRLNPREEVAPPRRSGRAGSSGRTSRRWPSIHRPRSGSTSACTARSSRCGPATNGGAVWSTLALPANLQNVTAVALGADRQNLYVATSLDSSIGEEGVYRLRLSSP